MTDLFAIDGPGGAVARHAIESARYCSTVHLTGKDRDRTDGLAEQRTLIRAITALIDPHLYFGAKYGLMRGSRVHRELFDRVETIIERATMFPAYDEESHAVACGALRDLCAFWPTDRSSMLGVTRADFDETPRQSV